MALACALFLAWRGAASLALHVEKLPSPFGNQLDALSRSEAQRIEYATANLERETGLPPGYLGELLAALEDLPPGARVWLLAGPEDARRRALVRLQHLYYPRSIKPIAALPPASAQLEPGGYLLLFDARTDALAERAARVLRTGPDWTLLGR